MERERALLAFQKKQANAAPTEAALPADGKISDEKAARDVRSKSREASSREQNGKQLKKEERPDKQPIPEGDKARDAQQSGVKTEAGSKRKLAARSREEKPNTLKLKSKAENTAAEPEPPSSKVLAKEEPKSEKDEQKPSQDDVEKAPVKRPVRSTWGQASLRLPYSYQGCRILPQTLYACILFDLKLHNVLSD